MSTSGQSHSAIWDEHVRKVLIIINPRATVVEVRASKQHVRHNRRIPASTITSMTNDWNKDVTLPEVKHPLNPGYGGGRSRSPGLDNEIRSVHDYARCKDLKN
jgi:hypothetical protein